MAKARVAEGLHPDGSPQENAEKILNVRLEELLDLGPCVADSTRVLELHAMRIASKRLRYTMEIFAPFHGEDFARAIDVVKDIQERLGKIHDADVLAPQLAQHAARLIKESDPDAGAYSPDFDALAGLLAICRAKRAEREAIYRKFKTLWNRLRREGFFERLRTLWRA